MLEELGIVYSTFVHQGSNLMLEVTKRSLLTWVWFWRRLAWILCKLKTGVVLKTNSGAAPGTTALKTKQLARLYWEYEHFWATKEAQSSGACIWWERSLVGECWCCWLQVRKTEATFSIYKLREQRWRVDGKGRMVHKASNQLLALVQNGGGRVEMRSFREADREVILIEALPAVCISAEVLHPWFMAHSTCFQAWRFRCLDQTRTVDSFVQFTPWQDMLVWDWATYYTQKWSPTT